MKSDMGPPSSMEIKENFKTKIMRDKKNTILGKYYLNTNSLCLLSPTKGPEQSSRRDMAASRREREVDESYGGHVQAQNGINLMGNHSNSRSCPFDYEDIKSEPFSRESSMKFSDTNGYIPHYLPLGSLHLSNDSSKSCTSGIKCESERIIMNNPPIHRRSELKNVFSYPLEVRNESLNYFSHPSISNDRALYPSTIKSETKNIHYPSGIKSEIENSYPYSMDKSESEDPHTYPYPIESDQQSIVNYSPNYYLDSESHSYTQSPSSYNSTDNYPSISPPSNDSPSNDPYLDRNLYPGGPLNNYSINDMEEKRSGNFMTMSIEEQPLDLSIPKAGAHLLYPDSSILFEEEENYVFKTEEIEPPVFPDEEIDEENSWLKKIKTGTRSRVRSPKSWEFLLRLLQDPKSNPSMIRWEDEQSGTFRLVRKDEIAKIWGMRSQKHKDGGLTYDNFARNLRYHYKTKMLVPVSEKHLVYRFGSDVMESVKKGLSNMS